MDNVILQSFKRIKNTKNVIMDFTMCIMNLINTIINNINSIISLPLSVLRDCIKCLPNAEHEDYYKDLHTGVSVFPFPFSLVPRNSCFIVTWSIYATVVKKLESCLNLHSGVYSFTYICKILVLAAIAKSFLSSKNNN